MGHIHETNDFHLETRRESFKIGKPGHVFFDRAELRALRQFQEKFEGMASSAFLTGDDENAKKYRSIACFAGDFTYTPISEEKVVEISYDLMKAFLRYASTDPNLSENIGLTELLHPAGEKSN